MVLSVVAALGVLAALAAPAPAYDVAGVTDGSVLVGSVRYAGTPPKLPRLPVSRDRHACGDDRSPEALVLGPERGVRDSVILVEGVERGKKPVGEAVLDTSRCAFVGHVTAVMAGERARVKNGDPVLHNPPGSLGKPRVFNVADGRPRYEAPRTVKRDATIAPGATATVDFELT